MKLSEEEKRKKIEELKERLRPKCINVIFDGAGSYCKKVKDTSGWHKFYRSECYGKKHNCKFPEFYKEK